MTIRKANIADAKDLSTLAMSLSHFYLAQNITHLPHWLADNFSESQFLDRLSSNDYTHFVVETDHNIVGFIAIKHPNHLYHLFVDEKYHGQGIGKQLWQYAFKALDLSKQGNITVRASLYAVPVYEKFGFVAYEAISEKDGVNFLTMAYTPLS